jgi:hypothetical protein
MPKFEGGHGRILIYFRKSRSVRQVPGTLPSLRRRFWLGAHRNELLLIGSHFYSTDGAIVQVGHKGMHDLESTSRRYWPNI